MAPNGGKSMLPALDFGLGGKSMFDEKKLATQLEDPS
jgi:hypothetical protein